MLGLIFLKYISDSFTAQQDKIRAELSDPENPLYLDRTFYSSNEAYQKAIAVELGNRDYYTAGNVFWVPAQARWQALQEVSILNTGAELPWGGKFAGVARLIDDAFETIEKDNEKLKGVLQRIFVQTERFITAHQGNINQVSIYGQEFNPTTWKLAAMNMAIRGIDYDFGKHNADSFAQPSDLYGFIQSNHYTAP